MAYNNSIPLTYTRSVATTTTSWTVNPPPGTSKCRVFDINASVTANFVGTTTAATIGVGTATNPGYLGQVAFGTIASPAQAGTALGYASQYNKTTSTAGASTANNPVVSTMEPVTGGSNTLALNVNSLYNPVYEILGPITITYTAPTGSPAGAATVDIALLWF